MDVQFVLGVQHGVGLWRRKPNVVLKVRGFFTKKSAARRTHIKKNPL
jgi:hypothetical protein